jgi:hypothetical protein
MADKRFEHIESELAEINLRCELMACVCSKATP